MAKPAIQGGFDFTHRSGFYLGTWMSNISWYTDQELRARLQRRWHCRPSSVGAPYVLRSNSAHLEWDFYGDYKYLRHGLELRSGDHRVLLSEGLRKQGCLPSAEHHRGYAVLGYKWLSLKYSKGISTNTFGVNESKGASYVDLSAVIPDPRRGVQDLAHVGRQGIPG